MKHKHAEVLIAIAEGREVGFKNNSGWQTLINLYLSNPIKNDDLEWRVKKESVIEVRYFVKSNFLYSNEINFYEVNPDLAQWDIKVTFEDGEVVKAEFPFKVKIDGLG